tara:strand:- start:961 stop:1341 length:381 start_codon:yes stop_codon:yes gene_type:complete
MYTFRRRRTLVLQSDVLWLDGNKTKILIIMKVMLKARGKGKTHALIERAAIGGGYIVCRTRQDASRIGMMAREMELNILFPITYDDFVKERYLGANISEFYIDDADDLLQSLSPRVRIDTITISDE